MSFTENSSQGLNTVKQVPNFIKYTGNIIKILKALMLTKLCGYILEVKNIMRDLMIAFKGGEDYLEPHC